MKKNLKKMVAVATAMVLTLSMSTVAFAADQKVDREAHDTSASTTFDSRTAEKYNEENNVYKFDNATESPKSSTDTANVKVTVVDNCTKIYNVTVEWQELSFTYTFNTNSVWSPEDHKYTSSSESEVGSWSAGKTVTITNHSNAWLTTTVVPTAAAEGMNYGVTIASPLKTGDGYEKNDANLTDASECAYGVTGNADKAIYEISVSGVPSKSDLDGHVVGTVKVTISKTEKPAN